MIMEDWKPQYPTKMEELHKKMEEKKNRYSHSIISRRKRKQKVA